MTPKRTNGDRLRVVGYARISRDSDDSTSIARQREIIRKTAESRGWDLVEILEDVSLSASRTRLDRPGLTAAREAIREGLADAVVVWRLDRLARSVVDMGTLLDEGLQVVSATEPLDTTSSMGRAMVEILQVFAALESRTIGERVRSSRDYLARQHRHGGGVVPYGYRSVPHPSGQGRALEVEPEEAAHVRAAADHVLEGGSLYGAVQVMRERGSKPRRAAEWSISSLRVVLVGEAVLGRLTHRGEIVRDDDGLPVTPWDAVLPLADVERLRVLLERKAGRGFHARKRATRLLSGLVFCGSCGSRMRVSTSTQSNGRTVRRYACQGKSDGRGCPAPSSVTADLLDAHVEEEFLRRFGRLPVVEVVERVREVAGLAEVEGALRDLSAAISRPGANVAALAEQISALHSRRDSLAAAPVEPVVETIATGERFAEAWTAREVDGRRALLEPALVGGVTVAPGKRGRKGLDVERVSLGWTTDADVVVDY